MCTCKFSNPSISFSLILHNDYKLVIFVRIKSVSCLDELFEQEKYDEVAQIVVSTFESDFGCTTVGKMGRPAQLGMLLHSFWYTDFDKCFLWCEECLFESYPYYSRPGPNRQQWEGVVQKCLLMMQQIIKNKSRAVGEFSYFITVGKSQINTESIEILITNVCKKIQKCNSFFFYHV